MGKNVMGEEPLCEKTGDYCEKEQARGSEKCKKCRRYKQGRRKQRDKEKQIRI